MMLRWWGIVRLFMAVSLWSVSTYAGAQPAVVERLENSPRHHEWVEVATPAGRSVRTWVVYPEVSEPATTVVVIHENKGLTDWVRGVADQLAEAGYLALAPDMLSQTGPDGGGTEAYPSQDAATGGIYKLPAEQVLADLDAVVEYGQSLEASNKLVAVGGFCWGGSQTFAYACHNPKIAAACVFYGSGPENEADYARIEAPVYGFYGGNDNRVTGGVPATTERMQNLGKQYEPVVYEGAGHGFMREGEATTDPNDPNRKARDQAWERWKTILAGLNKK